MDRMTGAAVMAYLCDTVAALPMPATFAPRGRGWGDLIVDGVPVAQLITVSGSPLPSGIALAPLISDEAVLLCEELFSEVEGLNSYLFARDWAHSSVYELIGPPSVFAELMARRLREVIAPALRAVEPLLAEQRERLSLDVETLGPIAAALGGKPTYENLSQHDDVVGGFAASRTHRLDWVRFTCESPVDIRITGFMTPEIAVDVAAAIAAVFDRHEALRLADWRGL